MVVKLFRTELTATGRPVLMSGEVERGMLDKARRAAVGRQWGGCAVLLRLATLLGGPALLNQATTRGVTRQPLLLIH